VTRTGAVASLDLGARAPRRAKTALVTGGGRGIGRAAGAALSRAGIGVALVARTTAEIEQSAAAIRDQGGVVVAVPADLGSVESADRVVQQASERLGRPPDILVNAAGMTGPVAALAEVEPAALRRVLDVNLSAVHALCRAAIPAMATNGWGRIVNVTSGLGRRVQPGLGSYSISKAALIQLSLVLDAEYRARGVRVFALEPGLVRSQMSQQLLRLPDSGVAAGVVRMLRDMQRDPGVVDAAESAQLIRLAATGQADDLAGRPTSIYEPDVRARLT
jgi:NAD(P)-dependent dehydrogenase (short-subunit alcohol dehydrogenase family)